METSTFIIYIAPVLIAILALIFAMFYITYRMAKKRHRDVESWMLLACFIQPFWTWVILYFIGDEKPSVSLKSVVHATPAIGTGDVTIVESTQEVLVEEKQKIPYRAVRIIILLSWLMMTVGVCNKVIDLFNADAMLVLFCLQSGVLGIVGSLLTAAKKKGAYAVFTAVAPVLVSVCSVFYLFLRPEANLLGILGYCIILPAWIIWTVYELVKKEEKKE